MKAAWIVKADPDAGITATTPDIPRPSGPPTFGPAQLSCQSSSWVDEVFCRFLPVVDQDPGLGIYAEVGNDRNDWGLMHAWIIPQPASASAAGE